MLRFEFLNTAPRKWGSLPNVLLMILLVLAPVTPTWAQSQSPSSSAPATQSSSPQQQPQEPAEAGGPQGEVGPVVVPKKKEQPPPLPKPKAPPTVPGLGDYSLQVNVPLVTVPVTITTKNGEFIPGLKKEDFRILEDGAPQKITNFSQSSEAPITAVLLVEFAATHYHFIYDMLNNAYGFASSLKPNTLTLSSDRTITSFTTSHSYAYIFPASAASRNRSPLSRTCSLDRASSLEAILRSSTRAARTMKGIAAKTKKSCSDKMPLSEP